MTARILGVDDYVVLMKRREKLLAEIQVFITPPRELRGLSADEMRTWLDLNNEVAQLEMDIVNHPFRLRRLKEMNELIATNTGSGSRGIY